MATCFLVAIAAGVSVSCDEGTRWPVGFALRESDGAVLVRLAPCVGELRSVTLKEILDDEGEESRVIWSAEGPGVSVSEVVLGEAPSGMTTETPLVGPLPAGSLSFRFQEERRSAGAVFDVEELSTSTIYVDGDHKTEAEALEFWAGHCD